MLKQSLKKIICGVLATTSVVACASTFTACETSHPKVQMTLEFNGKTYTLDYKLYRNIAPSTTEHFLALVENDYYDGLCVHNYDAGNQRMYTGGYTASDAPDDDKANLTYKAYYDTVKAYANFPVSVWKDKDKTNPTYTLYGEFEDNGFKVTSGDIDQSFGSLTMYYNTKDTTEQVYVPYLSKDKGDELAQRGYNYNSATSLFYISLKSDTIDNTNYCTFATLEEDSVEALQNFQDDLEDYIADNYGDDDDSFTQSHKVTVDADDAYVGNKSTKISFNVPKASIVIKSIEVTKY